MLLSVLPLSLIWSAIWISIYTKSMLFIIQVVTFILSSVGPCESTFAMHFISSPFSFIFSIIWPGINSLAMNIVIVKFTDIRRTVWPFECSYSVFLSIFIVPFIPCTIWPWLDAISLLSVFFPIPYILCSVIESECSLTMHVTILVLSHILYLYMLNYPFTYLFFCMLYFWFDFGDFCYFVSFNNQVLQTRFLTPGSRIQFLPSWF